MKQKMEMWMQMIILLVHWVLIARDFILPKAFLDFMKW